MFEGGSLDKLGLTCNTEKDRSRVNKQTAGANFQNLLYNYAIAIVVNYQELLLEYGHVVLSPCLLNSLGLNQNHRFMVP